MSKENRTPKTEHRKPNTENRGFTLVEMMVVLAIFSMVMGVAYTALSLNETYRDLVLIKIQLYRQNKKAIDSLCAELQRSQGARVNITDNASPIPDEIRFQIPLINAIDAQYNIPWGARQGNIDYPEDPPNSIYRYVRYRLNGANLVREVVDGDDSVIGGTQQEIIAENITNLQFTSLNPNYITININAQKMTLAPRHPINSNLESTVYLRN
jgi:prepilin-type N-terminal cleavage/methylation domain-containing protein